MWAISKKFYFEAAHHLPQLPLHHKCSRPHGHSYCVEVVLEAQQLDDRNFCGVDYADLDHFKDYLMERFDHRDLCEVMDGGQNTTAECLARHFYRVCKHWWPQTQLVRVYETRETWVAYQED